MIKLRFLILCCVCIANVSPAQTDTIAGPLQFRMTGLADIFYTFDFNKPENRVRQPFFYHYNRHNEINLNLGLIKFQASHNRYRAGIALHAGTYVNDNYANEPGVLKNVFESSAGIALNKKGSLWADAGIFASHIGFESAIATDNWTLTRSLLADNSPYYLTGAKLTLIPDQRWELAALICNGWQRITPVPGNSLPSFGTQAKYTAQKLILNWSTFVGTDDPDSARRLRYFNSVYMLWQLSKRVGLIAGFDIGLQQRIKHSSQYHTWSSPVLILRYAWTGKWVTALRAEQYTDRHGVIVATATVNGFNVSGLSANLDYTPAPNVVCRLETRWLRSQDKILARENTLVQDNVFVTASIAVKFSYAGSVR